MQRKDAPYPEAGGTIRPIFIGLTDGGWSYFSEAWHRMISNEHGTNYANHNMDGVYYNGGSWMRIEICGYITGKLHGWSQADKAIANRLWRLIPPGTSRPVTSIWLPSRRIPISAITAFLLRSTGIGAVS